MAKKKEIVSEAVIVANKRAKVLDTAISEIVTQQGRLRSNHEELIHIRFEYGRALQHIVYSTEYGDGAVTEIGKRTGEFRSVLYKSFHFAKAFGFDRQRLKAAIKAAYAASERVNLFAFEQKYLDQHDPEVVGGKEEFKNLHLARAEHASESLTRAATVLGTDAEVQGASMLAHEAMGSFLHALESDESRFECMALILYTDLQPCCVSGDFGAQAYRLFSAQSDLLCIPLSQQVVDYIENEGLEQTAQRFDVNFFSLWLQHLQKFLSDTLGMEN